MRDSEITEGCLGVFSPKLKVSDVQKMVFQSLDAGPFYLSDEQKELRRYDQLAGGSKVKPKTVKNLKKDLQSAGVTLPVGKPLCLANLQALAQQHGVQTTVEKQKIIQGWEGKPKGILQILWERGLIDELNYKATMKLDGRKNSLTRLIDESTSLRHLLGKCPDFKNEQSALQVLGQELGVVVDATPKNHAELAGEGIE